MLTILGERNRFCDRLSRRNFLQIGGLALGGMSLPEILQAEAAAGIRGSHKAVIMIILPSGPPHQDTFDLKTGQAKRGSTRPRHTLVDGAVFDGPSASRSRCSLRDDGLCHLGLPFAQFPSGEGRHARS